MTYLTRREFISITLAPLLAEGPWHALRPFRTLSTLRSFLPTKLLPFGLMSRETCLPRGRNALSAVASGRLHVRLATGQGFGRKPANPPDSISARPHAQPRTAHGAMSGEKSGALDATGFVCRVWLTLSSQSMKL